MVVDIRRRSEVQESTSVPEEILPQWYGSSAIHRERNVDTVLKEMVELARTLRYEHRMTALRQNADWNGTAPISNDPYHYVSWLDNAILNLSRRASATIHSGYTVTAPESEYWVPQPTSERKLESLNASLEQSREELLDSSESIDQTNLVMRLYPKVQAFILKSQGSFSEISQLDIPMPVITFGPEGSIDISWKTSKRRLLVNISEEDERASFAGIHRQGSGSEIRGYADPDSANPWILKWLVE